MRISDWSSDVCSSDLVEAGHEAAGVGCLELSEQPAHLLAADLVGIIEREKPVRLRVDRAGVAGSQPIFARRKRRGGGEGYRLRRGVGRRGQGGGVAIGTGEDRKSTRLNSSH